MGAGTVRFIPRPLAWKVQGGDKNGPLDFDGAGAVRRIKHSVITLQDLVNDLDELPSLHRLQFIRVPEILLTLKGMLVIDLVSWHRNTSSIVSEASSVAMPLSNVSPR